MASLLFLLLFGIITFGLLLAVRQTVTQAAAEGARAAIPIAYTFLEADAGDGAPPVVAAREQAERSAEWIGRTCDSADADGDGMSCDAELHDCDVDAAAYVGPNDPDAPDCLTVTVVVDNDDHPIVAPVPLLSRFLPDRVRSTAVAQLDNLLVE